MSMGFDHEYDCFEDFTNIKVSLVSSARQRFGC